MSSHGLRLTFRGTMAKPHDEEVDSTPLEGDRPGAHPVDVLGELPVDGDQVADTQLMPDSDLDPREVQGDRFDVDDDDLGMAPDLEDEPDAPDLQPDRVERIADSDLEEERDEDDLEDRGTARPIEP
ncbi:MAG TPA: hypothetical protein VFF12_09915 [Myxococcaceae bacterium]|nr:hypothetical protein [Myxococcaceae bacterium]